jgi:malate dehydrogenase (oxaloacetate-decarboxylating)
VVGKSLFDLKVVINGAGAAGIAIARLLRCVDNKNSSRCVSVKEVVLCDSKGMVHAGREDLNEAKRAALAYTNPENKSGSLRDALVDADVFIGVSVGNLYSPRMISKRWEKIPSSLPWPIPTPEIMPEEAYKGGAAIVGTGRSDLPNQINNVLGFPGIFRGALDARAKTISPDMKLAAAYAIADCIPFPKKEEIIPSSLDLQVAFKVAEAVREAALLEKNHR